MINSQQIIERNERRNAKPDFQSRIVEGDVVNTLGKLPLEITFDVIIADPPYNIGKDFGNNTGSMHINDYIDWTEKWLTKCFDLLADNGLMYVYGFAEILARIAVRYPIEEQRWLVWHYTNKAVPSSTFWQRSHESILCLWKPGEKRPALEIDQIREPYTKSYLSCAGRERKETVSRFGGNRGKKTIYQAHKNGALPRDVIKIPALAGGAGAAERWFMCRDCKSEIFAPRELKNHLDHDILKHPTQKPMELTKRLIQSRIKGSDGRVLIPFSGSGSECVVSQSLDIDYLGIELNPEFAGFARKWLKAAKDESHSN